MPTFKDLQDSLKNFVIQEQEDAHNVKTMNVTKYNTLKISMDPSRYVEPHVIIRISISEATYTLNGFNKINGGLGYEERLVLKWFGRYGIKEKLIELWNFAEKNKEDK